MPPMQEDSGVSPEPSGALLTASEVAEALGFHENTIYRMAEEGRLPCVRLGRTVRFRKADIDALVGGSH